MFSNSPINKALFSNLTPDMMKSFDIQTSIAFNLGTNVYGFVYVSKKGIYHIIINGNLSYEVQRKTFLHELKHIVYDMPKTGYIIGLDMQHTEIELG